MTTTLPVIIVVEGVVGIQYTLQDGRRTVAAYFTSGDIIDMRQQRSLRIHGNLVTLTRVRLCRLHGAIFQSVLEANHRAWSAFSDKLCEQINLVTGHAADLGKKQAVEKLASFILECRSRNDGTGSNSDAVEFPMPRVYLAEYMGLQPETVSRGLRRLEQMSVIRFSGKNRVKIENPGRLRQLANGVRA